MRIANSLASTKPTTYAPRGQERRPRVSVGLLPDQFTACVALSRENQCSVASIVLAVFQHGLPSYLLSREAQREEACVAPVYEG